ncbi:MAG TPA: hypothetical protein VFQ05_12305 [Candidatus Eisenbacteria bacterium]|nr:hypothetical protein [Candidatus Eisenbacteria bacterium]
MKPLKDLLLLPALAAVLTSCDLPGAPGACTHDFVPGIVVEVYDAETGARAAEGVDGWVFDGSYSDSLHLDRKSSTGEWLSLSGAGERPGDYVIRLRKPGYRLGHEPRSGRKG